jgi:hypothetical protein
MSRILLQMVVAVGLSLTGLAGMTQTFDFSSVGEEAGEDEGARLFSESCAICHNPAQSGRTPSKFSLSGLTTRTFFLWASSGFDPLTYRSGKRKDILSLRSGLIYAQRAGSKSLSYQDSG